MRHTCPRCGWNYTRPSLRSGFADHVLRVLWLAPVRCHRCRHRFYRFAPPWSKPMPSKASKPAVLN